MNEYDEKFLELIEKVVDWGGSIGELSASEAFNIAIAHVSTLLQDAYLCFLRESYGTAVFLSITALEETAKAELIIFRARGGDGNQNKGRDPLRDHAKKHILSVRFSTFMGRLPKILGEDACERLRDEAYNGVLNRLRETALYVQADETGVHSPKTAINRERAAEILLLALESADDILVGSTNFSMELGEIFEKLIRGVAEKSERAS